MELATPFVSFCIDKAESTKSKNPTCDSMRLAQLLAAEWKSLSEGERSRYELRAGLTPNGDAANQQIIEKKVDSANEGRDPKVIELGKMISESYWKRV